MAVTPDVRAVVRQAGSDSAVHEAKGAVKEKIGHALNKPDLEAEGIDEKIDGKIQKKVGKVERVIEKATGA